MKLIRNALCLRNGRHADTRLDLHSERIYREQVLPWFIILYTSFAIVDRLCVPNESIFYFVILRLIFTTSSMILFYYSRGRLKYLSRIVVTGGPYVFGVEYLMMRYHLIDTPYYAGLFLALLCSTTVFPVRLKMAAILYSIFLLPVIGFEILNTSPNSNSFWTVLYLGAGALLTCTMVSARIHLNDRKSYELRETLSRHLGRKKEEVNRQADELLRRKIFEKQFSPHVVSNLLESPDRFKVMHQFPISTIVVDIENSTHKADVLPPHHYREVIEEVVDTFVACCLARDVTLDRFTGDGFLAYSGAPVPAEDDLERALLACRDAVQMLWAKKPHLQSLWKSEFNVRFAIYEGPALVGFLGRGAIRNFAAIGATVTTAFRLSSVPAPWTILLASSIRDPSFLFHNLDWANVAEQKVAGLKGLGDKIFRCFNVKIELNTDASVDFGRCDECGTPLVLNERAINSLTLECPACSSAADIKRAA